MNRVTYLVLGIVLLLAQAIVAEAAQVKVYVGEVNVVGAQNRDELKAALQPLLASRLSGAGLIAVSDAVEADLLIHGTYVAIGSMFSLDAVVSTPARKTLARSYVQGESQAQLLSAVEKLAEKLKPELLKVTPVEKSVPVQPKAALMVAPVPVVAAAEEIVRVPQQQQAAGKNVWKSSKLDGAMVSLAATDQATDGSRELFVAESNRLYHYRLQSGELRLISENKFPVYKNILYLDTVPAGDGATDLLVTIMANEQLESQVWRYEAKAGKLQLLADKQPYFLRGVSVAGSAKRLYAQKLGAANSFGEPIYEAALGNGVITQKSVVKLPAGMPIYSFGQFKDKAGMLLTVALSSTGRVVVYTPEMAELWQSAETYGESELFMEKRDSDAIGQQEDPKIYLKQRIQVLANGEVMVSKNDMYPLLGVKAGLKNGRIYGLAWNGSDLVQSWHTRSTDNYVSDFTYDASSKELFQLEVVSRPNILSRGSSVVSVRKVE